LILDHPVFVVVRLGVTFYGAYIFMSVSQGDVALLLEVVTIIIKYLHEVHGQGS
jgi:hypothetical protein